MRGRGGVELLRGLRDEPGLALVPMLMFSNGNGSGGREGRKSGADDYLVKPVGGRELVARVASYVELGAASEGGDGSGGVRLRRRCGGWGIRRLFRCGLAGVDGKRNWFNRCWLELVREGNGGEEVGEGWLEGMHEEDAGAYMEKFGESFFGAAGVLWWSIGWGRGDGEWRWILRDGGGEIWGWGGVCGVRGGVH